jgi:glycolate oxidase FAD binding subunit
MDTSAILAELAAVTGTGHARPATAADAVAGAVPALVAAPADADGVAAVARIAARHGLALVPRAGGTKLDWAPAPERVDLIVDVSRLDAVIEHAVGEFVVRVGAGTTLAALRRALTPTGQRLALDEVIARSTVGGTIATGLSGPLRLGYGGVRDLLLGVTVVRADGSVTRSGSKVVKNVAGYDLAKLYTGSYGTLGIVTEAILRLHPLPEHAVHVLANVDGEAATGAAVAAVLASQSSPAAVEIHRPGADGPIQVAVLLDGPRAAVAARATDVAGWLGPGARVSETAPPWWGTLPGPLTMKIAVPRAAVPVMLAATRAAAVGPDGRSGGRPPVTVGGSAGLGVIYAGFGTEWLDAGPAAALAGALGALRAAATEAGGSVVFLRSGGASASGLDVWGPVPAIGLMRRVKREFDPERRLAPGRFVAGI